MRAARCNYIERPTIREVQTAPKVYIFSKIFNYFNLSIDVDAWMH